MHGNYLFRLEARTLNDIRALGGNNAEDDKRFATVERVSEINQGLYRTFADPGVRAAVTEPVAEAMRAMHPNRLRFAMFSDANPFMQPVKALAEWSAPPGNRSARTIRCWRWRGLPRPG